jgi:putative endonuclease
MSFHVYVNYSEYFDKIYIGMNSSLEKRFYAHNNLPKGWTKSFRPWRLVHTEEFEEKRQALSRKQELKSHQGRDFIRTQIIGR